METNIIEKKNLNLEAFNENDRRSIKDFREKQQTAKLNTIVDTCLETSQILQVLPTEG